MCLRDATQEEIRQDRIARGPNKMQHGANPADEVPIGAVHVTNSNASSGQFEDNTVVVGDENMPQQQQQREPSMYQASARLVDNETDGEVLLERIRMLEQQQARLAPVPQAATAELHGQRCEIARKKQEVLKQICQNTHKL